MVGMWGLRRMKMQGPCDWASLTTSATHWIPRRLHKSSLCFLSVKNAPHIHLTITIFKITSNKPVASTSSQQSTDSTFLCWEMFHPDQLLIFSSWKKNQEMTWSHLLSAMFNIIEPANTINDVIKNVQLIHRNLAIDRYNTFDAKF